MPPLLPLQKLPGMEGGKKCLCIIFCLTRRSRFRGKNAFWGILLGDSGGVVNSLDFCPALLKSLGGFYFRCVLSSQWKVVAVNLRILPLPTLKTFFEARSHNVSGNKQ